MTNSFKNIIAKSVKVTLALAFVLSTFSSVESATLNSGNTTFIENPKDKPKL